MSQTKMAGKVGISDGLLCAILKGDRRITSDRLTKFAEVTNIPRATARRIIKEQIVRLALSCVHIITDY